MRGSTATAALIAALVLAGCTGVYSPPARHVALESVALTPKGRVGASAEVGAATSTFDARAIAASGRARVRLAERLDGSAELNFAHFWRDGWSNEGTHPNVYAGRVGLKYRIADWFALGGGLGGGWSAGGGFLSPDLGPIVAYENPTLVPFASVRGYISAPLNPQYVRYDSGDDLMVDRPKTTYGWTGIAGLRLPLDHAPEPRASLLLGGHVTQAADADDFTFYFGGSLGAEVLF